MSGPLPIGIFDSGIGGLTVLAALQRQLPGEEFLYLGDTARLPYGTKSSETVVRYALRAGRFLVGEGIRLLVVACNTASAVALEAVAPEYDIGMLGVIDPGARAAVETTRNGRVGIIGTHATIASDAYPRVIHRIDNKIKVFSLACPLFVPLAEEGYEGREAAYIIAEDYLKVLRENGIDTLVLGCTHYPLLKATIQRVIGDKVTLIDSATATAKEAKDHLERHGLTKPDGAVPRYEFYVSDVPDKFAPVAERFLGRRVDNVIRVDITRY